MVASAAVATSFTTRVVSNNCSAVRNFGPCMVYLILSARYTESNACDSPIYHRFRHNAEASVQEAHHRQLPRTEDSDVPEVSRQAGAHAGRERSREVRRVRALFCRVSC